MKKKILKQETLAKIQKGNYVRPKIIHENFNAKSNIEKKIINYNNSNNFETTLGTT